MKYRTLGRTGLRVSEVGFGAWAIGGYHWGNVDDEESLAALRNAFELGINFVDTADVYGMGRSESIIGKATKGRRESVIIATKFGNDFYGIPERKYPPRANFSPGYAVFAVEQSLRRLGTDYIDIIQLHATRERAADKIETFDAMEKLRAQGKIRFWGVSVKTCDDGIAALETGRPDALQMSYSMVEQDAGATLFPLALERNVGVIAREPLCSGLLAGKWNRDTVFAPNDFRAHKFQGERFAKALTAVEELRFLLKSGSRSMAQAALRFVLSHPAVSVVIPGAKRPSQVQENAAASDAGPLSPADLERIHDLFQRGVVRLSEGRG